MEKALIDYLNYLNIPVSEKYIKKCLLAHPEYPSLLSIADILERLGIDHQIGQAEENSMDVIPFPCLLHFEDQGGRFVFVKNVEDLEKRNINTEDWDGIVLKAESTNSIVDKEHNEQVDKEKLQQKLSLSAAVALLALFAVLIVQSYSLLYLMLFGTSLAGSIVGYLLIAKDLGVTYKPVETFCNAGKRTNCDRILNAEDANLLGFFTFSDAAASYFFFQLLAVGVFLPLSVAGDSFLWGLAGASLLTIPVIGYSMYYQSIIANTWCRLCIIVDVILGLQLGIFGLMYAQQLFTFTRIEVLPLILSALLFITVASSVLLLKIRLQAAGESREATAAKRVKHHPKVFTQLLLQQEKVDITAFSPEITIGNPGAPLNILMVANLHCNPCRIAFNSIRHLLSSYPTKVHFAIRFTGGVHKTIGDLSASDYLIRYWHQYIFGRRNEGKRTQQLLTDWYNTMDPEVFLEDYATENGVGNTDQKPEGQHYQWIAEQGIKRTPTFFINGYKMPQYYRAKDLLALVPGLASLWNKNVKMEQESSEEFA